MPAQSLGFRVVQPPGWGHGHFKQLDQDRWCKVIYLCYLTEKVEPPHIVIWPGCVIPSLLQYDYSLERRVSEQARHRAVSIAAEASLQRNQIAALLKQQQQQQEEEERQDVGGASPHASPPQAAPNPPLLLSSDILTPTPVAPPTSQSSPTVGSGGGGLAAQQSASSSGEGGSSSSLIEDDSKSAAATSNQTNRSESVFKALGDWSIKEFEGNVMDPFEITSLQAINDMEVLQSVLQPAEPPTGMALPPSSASSPAMVASQPQVPSSLSTSQPVIQSSLVRSSAPTATQTSTVGPLPLTNPSSNSSPNLRRASDSNSALGTSPQLAAQTHFTPQEVPVVKVSTNPFLSGLPVTSTTLRSSNPFLSSEPVPNHHPPPFTAPVAGVAPTQRQQPQERSRSEPGVGTLVDLGADHEAHPKPPIPAPRTSPKVQCEHAHSETTALRNLGCSVPL